MSGADINVSFATAEQVRSLRLQLVAAERDLKDGLNTISRALQLLESWESKALNLPDAAPPNERAVAINRARGGRSRAFKIETDPELETFIRARINRLTYGQIAAEVAEAFPPHRQTSTSGIARWWAKVGPVSNP